MAKGTSKGASNLTAPGSGPAGVDGDAGLGDESPAPIPASILRRERKFLLLLAAAVLISGLIGWLTIPTDQELYVLASSHPDVDQRIGAMNSLVLRGYWHDRPPGELAKFLKTSPAPVRQFIADMHGGLLKR